MSAARASVRSLTRDFESLVDAAHRDEMARAEQQMRVEALVERAMAELCRRAEEAVNSGNDLIVLSDRDFDREQAPIPALGGVVRVIPMDRVSAVLVVSSQPRYIDAARRFREAAAAPAA